MPGCDSSAACCPTIFCAEEEWPDAKEIKAARRAEEEAKTPIPERCWALRNVAGASEGEGCRGQLTIALRWTRVLALCLH